MTEKIWQILQNESLYDNTNLINQNYPHTHYLKSWNRIDENAVDMTDDIIQSIKTIRNIRSIYVTR